MYAWCSDAHSRACTQADSVIRMKANTDNAQQLCAAVDDPDNTFIHSLSLTQLGLWRIPIV